MIMWRQYICLRRKKVSIWRWIILSVFFLSVAAISADYYNSGSILICVADVLNDPITICYYFMVAVLLANGGLEENCCSNILLKVYDRWKWIFINTIGVAVNCLMVLALFLITVSIVVALRNGGTFYNFWPAENILSLQGISPLGAMGLSVFFVYMRIFAFSLILLGMNILWSKGQLGFITIFGLTVFDRFFYEISGIQKPLSITPLEHTRIVYTEALLPMTSQDMRVSFIASVIYWIICIGLLLLLFALIVVKKDIKKS